MDLCYKDCPKTSTHGTNTIEWLYTLTLSDIFWSPVMVEFLCKVDNGSMPSWIMWSTRILVRIFFRTLSSMLVEIYRGFNGFHDTQETNSRYQFGWGCPSVLRDIIEYLKESETAMFQYLFEVGQVHLRWNRIGWWGTRISCTITTEGLKWVRSTPTSNRCWWTALGNHKISGKACVDINIYLSELMFVIIVWW